jgi:transcription elongation factor Elf1
MEKLTWKIDLNVKCPHCEKENSHTFYLNADTLICDECDKEFNIEIYATNIEVRSTK